MQFPHQINHDMVALIVPDGEKEAVLPTAGRVGETAMDDPVGAR